MDAAPLQGAPCGMATHSPDCSHLSCGSSHGSEEACRPTPCDLGASAWKGHVSLTLTARWPHLEAATSPVTPHPQLPVARKGQGALDLQRAKNVSLHLSFMASLCPQRQVCTPPAQAFPSPHCTIHALGAEGQASPMLTAWPYCCPSDPPSSHPSPLG